MTVSAHQDKCYLLVDSVAEMDINNETKLKENIEKGNKEMKLKCLKTLVIEMVKGYQVGSGLLMSVIRFLSPQTDHEMKKLLLLFWELLPKTQPNGNLITEMILVVDSYRKDLENPNEYVRSFTLRFLCKVNNCEILESLMPSIKQCLRHTKNFVRKNAIVAICTVYRKFPHLVANAPELILNYLVDEKDSSCIRNAFLMLLQVDKPSAVDYLRQCLPNILEFDSTLQLVTIEVMLKSSQMHPSDRAIFFPVINSLMLSNKASNAVRYEAANSMVILSSSAITIKRVVECYVQLMFQETDNNIRLVLLSKIKALIKQCQSNELKNMISTFSMDILSLLTQSGEDSVVDLSVAQCVLSGVQFLINDTASYLKATEIITREVVKLHSKTNVNRRSISMSKLTPSEIHMVKYMNLLIDTLYHFSQKCSDVSPHILPLLVETVYSSHQANASNVLNLIKLHIVNNPADCDSVLKLLIGIIGLIPSLAIIQDIFVIFIIHCKNGAIIEELLSKLYHILMGENEMSPNSLQKNTFKSNPILPDGSYAFQSSLTAPNNTNAGLASTRNNIFKFIDTKDIVVDSFVTLVSFLMVHSVLAVVASSATHSTTINKCIAMAIFIITSMLDNSAQQKNVIKGYWRQKIHAHLHIISSLNDSLVATDNEGFKQKVSVYSEFFEKSCENLNLDLIIGDSNNGLVENSQWNWADVVDNQSTTCVQVNDSMDFSTIFCCGEDDENPNYSPNSAISFDVNAESKEGASFAANPQQPPNSSLLNNVIQLTGLSDPIYVETITIIKSFEVILDILIVNRTNDTLQNMVVEFVSHGVNSTFAKSTPMMLAPFAYAATKLSIKVMSLENGTLYGNLFYDISSSQSDRNCIVLNPIYLDVTDYTKPFSCSQSEFLAKWKDLDWENTIHIKTECSNMVEFVEKILQSTKMVNLTPKRAMGGECKFLACNSGIISSFNEEALVNISMEVGHSKKSPCVGGIIRIRAGTEDMVLNIGEKIRHCMKSY